MAVCRALPDAVATMKGGLAGCSSTRSLPSKGPRGRGRGPAQGAVAPASPAGWRGSLGRAGLRRGAGASAGVWLPAPRRQWPGQWPRAGTGGRAAGAQCEWEVRGGRARFLGPARGCEPGRRVCAVDPGEPSWRPGVARSGGETQTKVARPWPTREHPRGAARPSPRHHQAIQHLAPTARVRGKSRCYCESESAAAPQAVGFLVPPPTRFGSYHRGYLVLSNPIFARALEGTAWHVKSN